MESGMKSGQSIKKPKEQLSTYTKIYNDHFKGGVRVSKELVYDRLSENEMIDGIMSNNLQRKNRSREEVIAHCSIGVACELGIAAITKGTMNPAQFDKRVRDTYGWDVRCGLTGLRLEVKYHSAKWWSYPLKNIQTLMKNIAEDAVDLIITAKVVEDGDSYMIYPRVLLDPAGFREFSTKSNYNEDYYFNHELGKRKGVCSEYNSVLT
jgi:hypothetical protein